MASGATGLDFGDANSVIMFLSNRFLQWHKRYQQLFSATSFFVGLPTKKYYPLNEPWKSTDHYRSH